MSDDDGQFLQCEWGYGGENGRFGTTKNDFLRLLLNALLIDECL